MNTPNDMVSDETVKLTPATDTLLMPDSALNDGDDPTSITSGLQQAVVRKPVFDSLRAYFKCRQIGMNVWEEKELRIHTMIADDHANQRYMRNKDQWPKHWALWYTGSAAYCCRAVSSKFYKFLPVFDVGLQPFQRHVSDTNSSLSTVLYCTVFMYFVFWIAQVFKQVSPEKK